MARTYRRERRTDRPLAPWKVELIRLEGLCNPELAFPRARVGTIRRELSSSEQLREARKQLAN